MLDREDIINLIGFTCGVIIGGVLMFAAYTL
jgi:hypothetical protein